MDFDLNTIRKMLEFPLKPSDPPDSFHRKLYNSTLDMHQLEAWLAARRRILHLIGADLRTDENLRPFRAFLEEGNE